MFFGSLVACGGNGSSSKNAPPGDGGAGTVVSPPGVTSPVVNPPVVPPAPDTQPPSIAIDAPTSSATYATSVASASLGGTVSDDQQVARVVWSNDRGGSGAATLSGSAASMRWSVAVLALVSGINVLTVQAVDGAGNSASKSLSVTYAPSSPPAGRWQPAVTDTWQWQLSGTLNLGYAVNVYDIDLFDTPASAFTTLRGRNIRVVCYFSAGTAENWRPDYASFTAADLGSNVSGWAGERWVDTRSATVRAIMRARLDLARSKGCDGVEPDNVDGYTNNPGFPLTAATQLDYNRFLATEAHARGLAIGLKNDVDQLAALASDFDFAVNEQCFEYSECSGYSAFTQAGKPVFNAEYASRYRNNTSGARDALCVSAKAQKIRSLVLPLQLDDSFRFSCD